MHLVKKEIKLQDFLCIFIYLYYINICFYIYIWGDVHETACMWRSEDNLWKSVLSFCQMDSRAQTQIIRWGKKNLDPLSHLSKQMQVSNACKHQMFMVRCWVIKGHQIKALILKKKKEVGIIPRPCPVMTSVCLWCSFPQSFSWKKTYVLGNRLLLKLCYIYTLGKLFLFCIIYQLFSMQTNPNLCHSFKYVSYQEGTSCSLCFFFSYTHENADLV